LKPLHQLKMEKDSSSRFKNVGKIRDPLQVEVSSTVSVNCAGNSSEPLPGGSYFVSSKAK
jgi:hypothetical protein